MKIDEINNIIVELIVYHKDIEIKRDNIIGVIEMPNEIRNSPSITINFLNKELFFLCRA